MSRGGDFQKTQRVILTFLSSKFCIFQMNLVVLAQIIQNQIWFLGQGAVFFFFFKLKKNL